MGSIVRNKVTRADLAMWNGVTPTVTRQDATGGTVTGLMIGNEVDVLQVYGSGTDRSRASIAAAISNISVSSNVTLTFAPGTWTIDSSLTIGSNFTCRIPAGCVFSVSSGQTLTFRGNVIIEHITWTSGSGTVVTNGGINRPYPAGHLYNYGTNTTPGTTDMTTAFNAALADIASSGYSLKLPGEDVLLTDQPTAIAGQITIEGEGPYQSRIIFRPTAANKAALKLSNGASRCERVVLKDFSIYSDDTTYTKIALDVYDLSVCAFERLFIWGSGGSGPSAGACWSGNSNTSIGIRTHGRESTGLKDVEIVADRCIVIAANANTAATDGEDMDHWQWDNLYLVGNANPLIEVDAGLGITETRFEGYQAWVGGTTGFKINDTRVAPTVPSRGISFKNVRREQGTDANAYVFDMVFAEPVQRFRLEDVLMATGSHGITIDGFSRIILDGVTSALAAGKNSIVTANATSKSVLTMTGCIWQASTNVTLTGLTQIWVGAYRSADYAGPSDAVYAGQITGTATNVELLQATCVNAATGLRVTGTTGDRMSLNPQTAGSGIQVRSENNAGTDYEPAATYAETYSVHTRTGVATVAEALRVDASTTATQTRMLVYDVDNATLERVTVGAADSGGAGFKVLRIPN